MRIQLSILLLLLLTACGETVTPGDTARDSVRATDDRADSLEPLRVRADGMTIWAEPRVLDEHDWLIKLRTSHSIAQATATLAGAPVDVTVASPRKLELRLSAAQLDTNLGEVPLLVDLRTTADREFSALVLTRARFSETSGSSRLYPWRNITPVFVGKTRVLRGRLTTPAEMVDVWASNDDDSEPHVAREDATHWTLDWLPGQLPWAAHPFDDALTLTGTTAAGARHSRRAPIRIEIAELGVSNRPALQTWPPVECRAATRDCLGRHDVERDLLSACGTVAEISPCLADLPVDDTATWVERFADDLRAAVIEYYRQYEADIVGAGGNTRPQALLAVDTRRIEEVQHADDVPSGHDLATYRVFSHPDVAYPGSDIVWFGVYDRATGALVEVYEFN